MLSKSVRLAAGLRVRLPSGLCPLVPSCWSPCPPSCWSLCPHCLPSGLPSCLRSFLPSCLGTVSVLSPFCFLFVSLLVSLVVPLLVGHCVRLVFLLSFTCASSLPLSLATLHICLPAALPCNPLHLSPSSGLRVACNPLHLSPCVYICLPALGCCVRLCLAFVSQRWAAVSALQSLILHVSPSSDCCVRPFIYLSPSSGLRVACNPLHLSPCVYICLPALDCCRPLCLAILCLPALDVASSSCRVSRFLAAQTVWALRWCNS